jgi:hypothetical protein
MGLTDTTDSKGEFARVVLVKADQVTTLVFATKVEPSCSLLFG